MRSAFLVWCGLVLGGTAACSPGNGLDKGLSHDDTGGVGGAGNSGGSGNASGGGDVGSGGITLTGGASGTAGSAGTAPECAPPEGPYCGDGMVNQASETCDDGNALPGDGCTGVCTVEPYF